MEKIKIGININLIGVSKQIIGHCATINCVSSRRIVDIKAIEIP